VECPITFFARVGKSKGGNVNNARAMKVGLPHDRGHPDELAAPGSRVDARIPQHQAAARQPGATRLWKALCESFFQRYVRPEHTVLELGCGYGEFINNIQCSTRIAMDRWAGITEYLNPGVRAEIGEITSLRGIADQSVDFVFASNIFEHLTQADMALCLTEVRARAASRGHDQYRAAELPVLLRRILR